MCEQVWRTRSDSRSRQSDSGWKLRATIIARNSKPLATTAAAAAAGGKHFFFFFRNTCKNLWPAFALPWERWIDDVALSSSVSSSVSARTFFPRFVVVCYEAATRRRLTVVPEAAAIFFRDKGVSSPFHGFHVPRGIGRHARLQESQGIGPG